MKRECLDPSRFSKAGTALRCNRSRLLSVAIPRRTEDPNRFSELMELISGDFVSIRLFKGLLLILFHPRAHFHCPHSAFSSCTFKNSSVVCFVSTITPSPLLPLKAFFLYTIFPSLCSSLRFYAACFTFYKTFFRILFESNGNLFSNKFDCFFNRYRYSLRNLIVVAL